MNGYRIKRCKECGKLFQVPRERRYNATKYCSIKCSDDAYNKNHKKAQQEYLKRYKELLKFDNYRLGDGMSGDRLRDFKEEWKKVKQELRRYHL